MKRQRSKTHPAASTPRLDRLVQEKGGDTYGLSAKLPDPTVCTDCGVMYRDGRWIWGSAPADAHRTLCPACHRTRDDYPAGVVHIEGEFAAAHLDEIQGLARNLEEREKQNHPLQRIMRIAATDDGGWEIATTDGHLARGIGDALQHAYKGELDYHYTEAANLLRVKWKR